jgi:DNA-binding NtrC family response regulator
VEFELQTDGRICILVVADHVLVRNFLNADLTAAGYLVLSAADSDESWQLAAAFSGRIRLLLVCLPDGAGLALAERLCSCTPQMAAIVISPETRALLAQSVAQPALMQAIENALANPVYSAGPLIV